MSGASDGGGRREELGVPPYLRGSVTRVIRSGLLVGAVLTAIGAVGLLVEGNGLGSASSAAPVPGGLLGGLAHLAPTAFVLLGVIVLVATPLARVALSTALFAAAGNRPFTWLTLGVLSLLAITVLVGVLA